ncbi:hypothetical protein J27TS7_57650 [Paenibacillus dendritiformis]|nr:hypothetical protein J27TS7_57650 [Paenibacillus dendritiformis]
MFGDKKTPTIKHEGAVFHIGLLESADILNEINKKLYSQFDGSNYEVIEQIRQNCLLIQSLLK